MAENRITHQSLVFYVLLNSGAARRVHWHFALPVAGNLWCDLRPLSFHLTGTQPNGSFTGIWLGHLGSWCSLEYMRSRGHIITIYEEMGCSDECCSGPVGIRLNRRCRTQVERPPCRQLLLSGPWPNVWNPKVRAARLFSLTRLDG